MIAKQEVLNKPCLINCNYCELYAKYCNGSKNVSCSPEGIYVLKKQRSKIHRTIEWFKKIEATTIKTPFSGILPRFIPQIRLNDERTFYWLKDPSLKEAFDTVIIRYDDIGTPMNLINKILRYNFPTNIIISTVIPDKTLDNLHPSIYLLKLNTINQILTKYGFTLIATTIDTYTYIDDPPLLSWSKMLESLIKAHKLTNSKIPLIGIIKGANEKQIEFSIKKLNEMGFKYLGFPCRELMEQKIYNLIKFTTKAIHKTGSKCLLIGFNSLQLLRKIPYIDSFSGLGWFISATYGKTYQGLKRKKTSSKINSKEIATLAAQNLKAIKSYLENLEKQTIIKDFIA